MPVEPKITFEHLKYLFPNPVDGFAGPKVELRGYNYRLKDDLLDCDPHYLIGKLDDLVIQYAQHQARLRDKVGEPNYQAELQCMERFRQLAATVAFTPVTEPEKTVAAYELLCQQKKEVVMQDKYRS